MNDLKTIDWETLLTRYLRTTLISGMFSREEINAVQEEIARRLQFADDNGVRES